MNKELIKKYKEEFDYFINQNKVLMGKKDHFTNKIKWYPSVSNPFLELSDNIIIIKNDEYVEYRKALAQGKSIQMLCKYDGMEPIWDDMTEVIKSIGFVDVKENYRITPEKPKFKVGAWVKHKSKGKNT